MRSIGKNKKEGNIEMILKRIKVNAGLGVGEETNCYIIADENSAEAMVIDPGGEVDKIISMLDLLKVKVKYIFITHCHGDHIGGVEELKSKKGGTILIHYTDAEGYNNEDISLTYYVGIKNPDLSADSRMHDDDLIHIGDIEFRVIHTPGHTKGGVSLYCKEHKMVFTGDTMFRGTWGRTDLPTGSIEDIMHSITNKLMILPEDTIVYPGHGKSTIIKEEEPIYLNLKGKEF